MTRILTLIHTTMDMTKTIISAADKDLISGVKGFIARYIQNRAFFNTCQEAYEHTESQYSSVTGRRRYSDYDSFRVAQSKYYKKKRAHFDK